MSESFTNAKMLIAAINTAFRADFGFPDARFGGVRQFLEEQCGRHIGLTAMPTRRKFGILRCEYYAGETKVYILY